MRVEEVAEFFGSHNAMAKAIGISASAVYQWGDIVPPSRRENVRKAMRSKAAELDKEAVRLRAAAGKGEE